MMIFRYKTKEQPTEKKVIKNVLNIFFWHEDNSINLLTIESNEIILKLSDLKTFSIYGD